MDQQVKELPIQVLYLTNNLCLISKLDEVLADIGQPDCKLISPCIIDGEKLSLWMSEYTNEKEMLISSDKILTMVEPNQKLLDLYFDITK